MCEAPSSAYASIAATAATLELPPPHERSSVLRGEAALLLDGLLTRVARHHGALDVVIGEGLNQLMQGDGLLQVGPACLRDYARERLGIGFSTARGMARLARELASRPLLSEALRSGDLTWRQAQTILPVAIGAHEATWIAYAKEMTIRALEAAVRQARPGEADTRWSHVEVLLKAPQRQTIDRALELARVLIGSTTPRWELLQAVCEQYLRDHPVEPASSKRGILLRFPLTDSVNIAKEMLELETARWAALDAVDGVASPGACPLDDPFAIDERLREIMMMRRRWDVLVGHLALLVQELRLWRDMGFRNFAHYCTERLQMSVRTVQQRTALEKRLYEFPSLRRALIEGRVSYEQARVIVRSANGRNIDEWIARAQATTCIALEREVNAKAEAQMCSRPSIMIELPDPAADLVETVCRTVESVEGRRLDAGECLERIGRHFIEVWEVVVTPLRRRFERVLKRDLGRCQVPGCSLRAKHVHHIKAKQHGGGDEEENLISLCAGHHLRGIHLGYIEVEGSAPDRLIWRIGVRPGAPPLLTFGPDARPREEERVLAA